jgi:ribonuclease D
MPKPDKHPYELIEDFPSLEAFHRQNASVGWMCFDTEFIGERRFTTTICLIQVATEHGCFLIDPVKISNLKPLLQMLESPDILKIVHAGENDFRLFHAHFGILPRNVFDTQLAASFAGYRHPISFARLVDAELGVHLSKGQTVTNWENRPFDSKQLSYAVADVVYLVDIWRRLTEKLTLSGRLSWAAEEFRVLELAETYAQDPYKEVLENTTIKGLRKREQVFLLRLLLWRTAEARKRNHSKEMVLPAKYINPIVRVIHSGKESLTDNRRIPDSVVRKYSSLFQQFYQEPATPEETEILRRIPKDTVENEREALLMEMLDLLVRYKSLDAGISSQLVLPRGVLRRMREDMDYFDPLLEQGWRREFLGREIVEWFRQRKNLVMVFREGTFELRMV